MCVENLQIMNNCRTVSVFPTKNHISPIQVRTRQDKRDRRHSSSNSDTLRPIFPDNYVIWQVRTEGRCSVSNPDHLYRIPTFNQTSLINFTLHGPQCDAFPLAFYNSLLWRHFSPKFHSYNGTITDKTAEFLSRLVKKCNPSGRGLIRLKHRRDFKIRREKFGHDNDSVCWGKKLWMNTKHQGRDNGGQLKRV
jgi:hypothetical protein